MLLGNNDQDIPAGGQYPGMYSPFSMSPGNLGSISSPYLNIDPRVFKDAEPQYILPEGASSKRGVFELAFSHIGGSVMGGGVFGLGVGVRNYALAQGGLIKAMNNAQVTPFLNHSVKHCAGWAQTLGCLAVIYSGLGVLISWQRGWVEDELNTLASATASGAIYRSPAGYVKAARGGAVGLGIALAYCGVTNFDRIREIGRSLTGR